MSRWMTTILFLAGSAILTHWIPFSSFFRNLDTTVHEFGHAVTTLLVSGRVMYIELFADHSGVTYSYVESGWRVIPVALAGYVTASLFALYLFYAYRTGNERLGFAAMSLFAAASLLLFVRNGFGVVWLTGFIVVNIVAAMMPFRFIRQFYYLLVAFISLEESVVGPIYLLVLSVTNSGQAGDAANLARATAIPSAVWAAAFVVFSLWCARWSIGMFLRGRTEKRKKRAMERPVT